MWECLLVGYVLGQKPGYKAIQRYTTSVWKKISPPQIHQVGEGVFLFRFFLESDMAYVMANRWSFNRAPLILQKWHPSMRLDALKLEKVAVWVRFGCLYAILVYKDLE